MSERRARNKTSNPPSHNVQYSLQDSIDHSGVGLFQVSLSFVCGICWMGDSMEIMLLSILGPILSCDWELASWQEAFLTSLVMGGMVIGSPFWGMVTDKYGRKQGLILAALLIGYFGVLSAFSPSYTWMAILRFLVGCCLAALPQTATLYSEYLPSRTRPAGMLFLAVFFSLGAAVEVVIAMFTESTVGWRYLIGFTAIPVFIFLIFSPWLPESARYYLTSDRYDDAVSLLQKVARINRKAVLPGKLATVETELDKRGELRALLEPSHRPLTYISNLLWFLYGFLYYGIALLLPTLLNKPDGCHGNDIEVTDEDQCLADCIAFSTQDYIDLVITSLADVPGLFLAFVFLSYMGRRASMALGCLIFAVVLLSCNICMSRTYLTVLIFVARASLTGAYQTMYTYTTESHLTTIRALAMGIGGSSAKLGALCTPYIAQVLTDYSAFASFTLYGIMGVLAAVVCWLLPFDTRGRPMQDTSY